jgi:hypothetical protein
MSLHAEYDLKLAALDAQRQRVAEFDRARKDAAQALDRARAPWDDYWREVGGGDRERDTDLEDSILADVRSAEGSVSLRVEVRPFPGEDEVVLVARDDKAEALYAGAVERLDAMEAEFHRWVADNLTGLAVERAMRARLVQNQCENAMRVVREAAAAFEGERAWWARVLLSAREHPGTIPHSPFEFVNTMPTAVPLPLPEDWTP